MCAVIVLSVLFLIGRFVYLFHDRLPGGLDIIGGPGCYMMAKHSCTFETEVTARHRPAAGSWQQLTRAGAAGVLPGGVHGGGRAVGRRRGAALPHRQLRCVGLRRKLGDG